MMTVDVDNQVEDEKLQYDIQREAAKNISLIIRQN